MNRTGIPGAGPAPATRRPETTSAADRAASAPRPAVAAAPMSTAVSRATAEPLSMQRIEQFFTRNAGPQGNPLVSEIVDDNGPLPGREPARAKRKPGGLAMQFIEEDRPLLFAPNDAPDELPGEPTEMQRSQRDPGLIERRRRPVLWV